jgi:hypothetical protein
MGDAIENDLPRGQLNSLNRLLFGIPVQEDVQFRHFGNPTAVDFTVEFDREFQSHRLAPLAGVIAESEMQRDSLANTGAPRSPPSPVASSLPTTDWSSVGGPRAAAGARELRPGASLPAGRIATPIPRRG